MRAFLDSHSNLTLLIDTETPEELSSYSNLTECLSICFPNLIPITNPNTAAPIFTYENHLFWFPDYLIRDPMEFLRDYGTLTLQAVLLRVTL